MGETTQLLAVAELRWQMFWNSLRTTKGNLELVSRLVFSLFIAAGGLGGLVGMGVGSYYLVAENKPEYLAIMLWAVFLFWQVFPLMAVAFTNNPHSSELLRFPLSYRSYFLIRLAYGSLDLATVLGSLWLLGMLVGITVARASLFPWALLVLLLFATLNLLFMQMVFAWLERWLVQRRTREIMGVLFILVMLSFQLIGPMMGKRSHSKLPILTVLQPVQRVFPPGLAADAIVQASHNESLVSLSSFLLLAAISMVLGYLLHVRLRRQFRGETISEVDASPPVEKAQGLSLGWRLPGFSPSIAAVFEKEVRYILRSGPVLLILVMPTLLLVISRFGAMNSARQSGHFLIPRSDMAFPATATYALLALTSLIYNNFGGDGAGVQFFYAAPVRFRQIVLGKNLTYAGILVANTLLAWFAVSYLYGRPAFAITVATLAGLLFAAPINFTVGNVLSFYSPKRVEFARFGRQRVSQITLLISLGVQFVVIAVGVTAFWLARLYQNFWIASLLFLVLSTISFSIYCVALHFVDYIALKRRDTLLSELCRA